MGRHCGLEQWEVRHSIVNLVLVMSTFLKYEARSSVETRSRRWCEKGGERKVIYLVSGGKKLVTERWPSFWRSGDATSS